jgi:hypothetical protein
MTNYFLGSCSIDEDVVKAEVIKQRSIIEWEPKKHKYYPTEVKDVIFTILLSHSVLSCLENEYTTTLGDIPSHIILQICKQYAKLYFSS